MFKYLITQKVFILVVEARPSMDGLDPPLAPNRDATRPGCKHEAVDHLGTPSKYLRPHFLLHPITLQPLTTMQLQVNLAYPSSPQALTQSRSRPRAI